MITLFLLLKIKKLNKKLIIVISFIKQFNKTAVMNGIIDGFKTQFNYYISLDRQPLLMQSYIQ